LRAGDRQGPLQVYAAEGFSGATYLALAKEALRQVDAAIAELEQLRQQESGPVAEAIRKRVETAAATVAPFRQKTGGAVPLDAAEWLRTDAVTTRLRTELRSFIWQARLDALLSGI
jgi:hypothetical protein